MPTVIPGGLRTRWAARDISATSTFSRCLRSRPPESAVRSTAAPRRSRPCPTAAAPRVPPAGRTRGCPRRGSACEIPDPQPFLTRCSRNDQGPRGQRPPDNDHRSPRGLRISKREDLPFSADLRRSKIQCPLFSAGLRRAKTERPPSFRGLRRSFYEYSPFSSGLRRSFCEVRSFSRALRRSFDQAPVFSRGLRRSPKNGFSQRIRSVAAPTESRLSPAHSNGVWGQRERTERSPLAIAGRRARATQLRRGEFQQTPSPIRGPSRFHQRAIRLSRRAPTDVRSARLS